MSALWVTEIVWGAGELSSWCSQLLEPPRETKPSNHFFPDRLATAAAHNEILQPNENQRGRDKSSTPFCLFLAPSPSEDLKHLTVNGKQGDKSTLHF